MLEEGGNIPEFSVGELSAAVKRTLEDGFGRVRVRGEVTEVKAYGPSRFYFSLKDAGGKLRSVVWAWSAARSGLKPENGVEVIATGRLTTYADQSTYQLTVERLDYAGEGALLARIEALRRRLAEEGLFDAARKRALPAVPAAIGIVTSPQAAALRDVLATLRARWPRAPVVLYPTPVQGDGAAERIAAAVDRASARAEVDVLIVCRGGGSLEDLWAFNEAVVARAIARCTVPVVAGVGHETDTTIADFVADVRAPTPTAAAVAATPDRVALARAVDARRAALHRLAERDLDRRAQRLDGLERRLVHPGQRLARQRTALDVLQARGATALARRLERSRWRVERAATALDRARPDLPASRRALDALHGRLARAVDRSIERRALRLDAARAALAHLDPQAVLGRGFAIARTADGHIVRDAAGLDTGTTLALTFARGTADVEVVRVDGTG